MIKSIAIKYPVVLCMIRVDTECQKYCSCFVCIVIYTVGVS